MLCDHFSVFEVFFLLFTSSANENNDDEVQQQLQYLAEIFQKAQEQHIHEQRVLFKRLEEKMEKMMEKMEDLDNVSTVDRYTKTYTYC